MSFGLSKSNAAILVNWSLIRKLAGACGVTAGTSIVAARLVLGNTFSLEVGLQPRTSPPPPALHAR